jgi:hypothetical protein
MADDYDPKTDYHSTQRADDIVAEQRAIQDQVREADRLRPREEMKGAMQAGARVYPEPPFAKESLDKPGLEADQDLAPLYDAPYYKGSGKLEGKVAIVTGGDSGIGRSVCVLFARDHDRRRRGRS